MKGATFAFVFILTACFVIASVALYPDIVGQAAVQNSEYVFGLFLGPFCVFLFFGWLGEKLVLKIFNKQ
jgi:hypothetical protein